MNGKQLKNSILQWAIQGKLVPQDPNDEPASALLERIREEKAKLVKEKKIKKNKNESIIYRGDDNSYYEKFLSTGEVKCIDEEIPFEIPANWEWCRLGDLAEYRKGPFGSSLTKSMFIPKSNTSIKVFEQKNAIQKDYELGDYFISQEKFETMQSFIVKPLDIIVSCAGTIGETYQLPSSAPIGIINQALMRVKLHDLEMAKYWEMYFHYILLNEAKMKGSGSAIKNIPPFDYLKAIIVAIPPIKEQKRIFDKYSLLTSLSDKYDELQKKLNVLNNEIPFLLKKSILQEAIQGKIVPQMAEEGTAEQLIAEIRKEKEFLVKEEKLKKSALTDSIIYKGDDNKYYEQIDKEIKEISEDILFDLPDKWQWGRIGTIFMHNNGKQLNKGNTKGKLMKYITTSNLYWDGFVLDNLKEMPFEENEMERCMAVKGDLLVCEGGDIGRSCIWNYDFPIMLQNHIHKLRPYIPVCTKFFYYIFKLYNLTGLIGGKGIGIQGFSSKALHNTLVPLPPLKEQHRIVAQIEKLFEQLR